MNNDVENSSDRSLRKGGFEHFMAVVSIHKNTSVLVMGTTSDPFDI